MATGLVRFLREVARNMFFTRYRCRIQACLITFSPPKAPPRWGLKFSLTWNQWEFVQSLVLSVSAGKSFNGSSPSSHTEYKLLRFVACDIEIHLRRTWSTTRDRSRSLAFPTLHRRRGGSRTSSRCGRPLLC